MRAALFAALLFLPSVGPAHADPIARSEIFVTDGDTIEARGHRWRLVGFDTPELSSPRRRVSARERELGDKATRRLDQLLAGGKIDLKEVSCVCRPGTVGTPACNFGRLCAVLSVDGVNVGETLIAEHLARPYRCSEKTYRCRGPKAWWR